MKSSLFFQQTSTSLTFLHFRTLNVCLVSKARPLRKNLIRHDTDPLCRPLLHEIVKMSQFTHRHWYFVWQWNPDLAYLSQGVGCFHDFSGYRPKTLSRVCRHLLTCTHFSYFLSFSCFFFTLRQIQGIPVDRTERQNHRGRLPLVRWEPSGEYKPAPGVK